MCVSLYVPVSIEVCMRGMRLEKTAACELCVRFDVQNVALL